MIIIIKGKEFGILTGKVVALTVILMVVNGIGSRFLPATKDVSQTPEAVATSAPASQPSGSFLTLVVVVMFLQLIALAYPVVRSKWSGWCLVVTVFLLYFGTVSFMSQIESLIYLGRKMPEGMLSGLFMMGLFNAAVFAPILIVTLGKWRTEVAGETAQPWSWTPVSKWAGRVLIGGGVYLALYYLFGYFVAWQNPLVREYYGGTDPGSFLAQMSGIVRDTPWMLPIQFIRGILWVALALLVIRMMKGRWWESGLAASLLFTVPAVYLLFPNPLMPEPVRMAHLVETAPYQFLFGWLVAWLFRGPIPLRMSEL